MIRKDNLEAMIKAIGYVASARANVFEKKYVQYDCVIEVDFDGSGFINYPEDKGMKITRKTTCNFAEPENFVVLECITRLMDKGYRPEHIELEKEWALGHEKKSGFADILVKDEDGKTLFIVECKTAGNEYKKEYNNLLNDGGQLFSYWQQEGNCKWLSLYASDFDGSHVSYTTETIDCSDDANILASAEKDSTILLYKDAHTVEDLFTVWGETYDKRLCGDVIFRDDSKAYQIGVKPLRKVDLKDFSENDKVVNKFEEILRHNNVSDKENAFNRLIALFICKLVDEIQKGDLDIVDFQYKVGTDTYETLQDRLQRLHKEGMEKFMREEIFYVADDYAENLVQQYTGHKRQKMIEDLRNTLRILKFYTNNDFTFIDVHNEELFYQNGKILVEVVQLFENYRIIGSNDVQMLGDLFEQLLNKGFKQNEGQFFTPIPITRFIWDSLPVERIIKKADGIEFPKMIDYACGAGHFLTQGFEAINAGALSIDPSYKIDRSWVEHKIFGVEKDYRLARVSKISLFMHGAGNGNIIFGDGLENYPDKDITPASFDILVANPPYSVRSFKPHLKLKDNKFSILDKISNDGSEIETLFVERISQLVKPEGVAAVVLPSSILNKENESFIGARETILKNFMIRSIAQLGSKTFGATGTNTVILFLEKYNEPPKRIDLVTDSVASIFDLNDLTDWEDDDILRGYLQKISVNILTYRVFVKREKDYTEWMADEYFKMYVEAFISSTEYANKTRQKTFSKLSEEDKLAWYNEHFYDYVFAIEKEKIAYFALVYQQRTLIITAPDDNKAQEKFLGYKWSNRKGQEGIQIITPGGMLYSEDDRNVDDKVSGLIRNSFLGKEYSVPELAEYSYYLRLQDMIDFKSLSFTKTIRTAKVRELKTTPGLVNYKLNDKIFEISIGNRVLSSEIIENGSIPIISANVFEEFGRTDKQNLTDFSVPSIIWGIDGDWMVNIVPANTPFYPTDHCGVLRIHSTDILPQYMAIALEVEGTFEKFSRNNRASAQRIKNLIVQVPSLSKQQEVVDEIALINDKITNETQIVSQLFSDAQTKFTEMFGTVNVNEYNWDISSFKDMCEIITDGEHQTPLRCESGIYLLSARNVLNHSLKLSDVDYIDDKEYLRISKRIEPREGDILISCSGTIGRCTVLPKGVKCQMVRSVALLRFNANINPLFAEYMITSADLQKQIKDSVIQQAQPNLFQGKIQELIGFVPPMELQNEFAAYINDIIDKHSTSQSVIDALTLERKQAISKYFK
ncbi:MAG: N-6 DNA methylase [Acetatifactor sp.]|nr:N-6 DNA methylase [Acetatifactor sp.]